MFLIKSQPREQEPPTVLPLSPSVTQALTDALIRLEQATESINSALDAYYESEPQDVKNSG